MSTKKTAVSKKAVDGMIKDLEAICRRQSVELDQLEVEIATKKAEIAKTNHQLLKLEFQKEFGEEY